MADDNDTDMPMGGAHGVEMSFGARAGIPGEIKGACSWLCVSTYVSHVSALMCRMCQHLCVACVSTCVSHVSVLVCRMCQYLCVATSHAQVPSHVRARNTQRTTLNRRRNNIDNGEDNTLLMPVCDCNGRRYAARGHVRGE